MVTMTASHTVEVLDVEHALVERLRAGDEKALVDLVRRYQAEMVSVTLGFVGTRAVAEETVQDAWLRVVRGIGRFAERSSLRTWLFHIVANQARGAGAKEHRNSGPTTAERTRARSDLP